MNQESSSAGLLPRVLNRNILRKKVQKIGHTPKFQVSLKSLRGYRNEKSSNQIVIDCYLIYKSIDSPLMQFAP